MSLATKIQSQRAVENTCFSSSDTTLEWVKLQADLQYTLEVSKLALVKLAFSHILQLFGMIAWGVGAMPFNVQAKLKRDENLALVI